MKLIPCNVCGGSDTQTLFSGYDRWLHTDTTLYTLVKCTKCGLMYLNPQPTTKELERYYPADYPPYQSNYQVFKETKTLSFLKKLYHYFKQEAPKKIIVSDLLEIDQSKKIILDFGCGSGAVLLELQKKHQKWELHGFDISTNKTIKKIAENITIHYGDMQSLEKDYFLEKFDIIYLSNVLEHVSDPKGTINQLCRLLKNGGEMTITVPNIDSIKFKIFGRYFSGLDIPRHLYHFNSSSIATLCAMCKLDILHIAFTGSVKSTIASFYNLIGSKQQQFNPITYKFFTMLTNIMGPKKINDDVMIVRVRKN